MKANEAPEKIYISYKGYGVFSEDGSTERTKTSQIEYIRTDVFIEKACEWLGDNMRKWFKNMITHGYKMIGLMIEDFKKAMKL